MLGAIKGLSILWRVRSASGAVAFNVARLTLLLPRHADNLPGMPVKRTVSCFQRYSGQSGLRCRFLFCWVGCAFVSPKVLHVHLPFLTSGFSHASMTVRSQRLVTWVLRCLTFRLCRLTHGRVYFLPPFVQVHPSTFKYNHSHPKSNSLIQLHAGTFVI